MCFKLFGDLSEGVMLLKTESLKTLFPYGDKSTSEIKEIQNAKMFPNLSQDSIQRFSWAEIKRVKYATMNYNSSTKWSTLLEFIFGINGIQAEFVFIDAFCLPGSIKDLNREEVLSALSKLFAGSSEHHIMEPGSLLKGWTWYDLSQLDRTIRPTLHSSTIDFPLNEMLIENITTSGFEFVDFSVPEDRDIVRN